MMSIYSITAVATTPAPTPTPTPTLAIHAKEENRQRLEGRLPPTAGSLIFRPTRRVGHDFLELQCGKTNAGQILLRALEEKAPFSPPPGRVPLQPPLRHRHCCHHLPLRQWLALRLALPALRHRHCCLGGLMDHQQSTVGTFASVAAFFNPRARRCHRHCCLLEPWHLPLRQWLALSRQRLALQPQHRRQRLAGLPPHR